MRATAVVLAASLLCLPAPAHAQRKPTPSGALSVALAYHVAPGLPQCPGADFLHGAMVQEMGYDPFVDGPAPLRFQVSIARRGGKIGAVTELRDDTGLLIDEKHNLTVDHDCKELVLTVCTPLDEPPPSFSWCIFQPGDQACPSAYLEQHTAWTGIDDERGCSGCACGPPTGSACTGTLTNFSDPACSDPVGGLYLTSDPGACLTFPAPPPPPPALGSKLVEKPPAYTAGTCAPAGGQPIGQAVGTGAVSGGGGLHGESEGGGREERGRGHRGGAGPVGGGAARARSGRIWARARAPGGARAAVPRGSARGGTGAAAAGGAGRDGGGGAVEGVDSA